MRWPLRKGYKMGRLMFHKLEGSIKYFIRIERAQMACFIASFEKYGQIYTFKVKCTSKELNRDITRLEAKAKAIFEIV